MNTKVKGYFLGAIAAATYGTNPLFALPLYKDGMDPDSVLFFRYLFAIPILGMMIKGRGRSFKIEHKAAVPLIVMGLLVAFSIRGNTKSKTNYTYDIDIQQIKEDRKKYEKSQCFPFASHFGLKRG